jgi:hypothetical protein
LSVVSPNSAVSFSCAKSINQTFGKLVFRDSQGNEFYLNNSDLAEQWRTDKPIPSCFNRMFDNTHFIPNDTSVADSIFDILAYPNPSRSPYFSIQVQSKKQVLMHLLIVDINGNFTCKENIYSGKIRPQIQARFNGIEPDRPMLTLGANIDLAKVFPNPPNAYYRVFYYFSTKDNSRFGEGYGDIYNGNCPSFVYSNY